MTPHSIYAAGPIDLGKDISWKDDLVDVLKRRGLTTVVFNPASAFKVSVPFSESGAAYIQDINTFALDNADIVVMSLPSGVQTVGTIIELQRCATTSKPLYLLTNIDIESSAYLLNMTKHSKAIINTRAYETSRLAVEALVDQIVYSQTEQLMELKLPMAVLNTADTNTWTQATPSLGTSTTWHVQCYNPEPTKPEVEK